MKGSVRHLTEAAVIASAYLVLSLPLAQLSFGPLQVRPAEALMVLAALTPAALPGLTLGCLLTNLLLPQSLGPVDVVLGSLATLLAAWLIWRLKKALADRLATRETVSARRLWLMRVLAFSPAVWVNALVVGSYLPFLIPDLTRSWQVHLLTILSLALSQSGSVYLLGYPLYLAFKTLKVWEEEHGSLL